MNVTPEKPGSWLRVAVGVPHQGTMIAETAFCIANMMAHFARGSGGHIELIPVQGFVLPEQRSAIWAEACKAKATHLLFVDSDITFPEDALLRLLQHGLPIVGVNYPRKRLPVTPTAYADRDDYTGPVYTHEDSRGLEKVKHMGFGLCLIDMRVFDALFDDFEGPALFHFEPIAKAHYTKWTTEDVYFFRRCAQKNVEAYIDHDLSQQIGHVGLFKYSNWLGSKMAEETRAELDREPERDMAKMEAAE